MRNPIHIRYQMLVRQVFFVIMGSCILSCSQKKSIQRNTSEKKDTLKPPVTIAVKNPFIVHLDTCPPPLTITIPDRKKDSFVININGSRTVILPPEKKPADFSVLMQNYTGDRGVALSGVHSSCMAGSGEVWFAS